MHNTMLEAEKFLDASPELSGKLAEFCHHANKKTDLKTPLLMLSQWPV